jgi:hypothetical protein
MNDEQTCLVNLLKQAIQMVYTEQRFLLQFAQGDRTGLEQAFVFRTGVDLSVLLNGTPYEALDLDSEYNKNHGDAKTSNRFPNGLRPDLIIHRRDSSAENKLVAEFKGWWNNDIADDIKKLEDLTNPHDNYRYMIGVFVRIDHNKANYRFFINGNEYE